MKKRLIRYKAYRNMFLHFIFLTALITLVVCSSLFVLFSSSTAKEIGNISKSMLEQTGYASNIINDQLYDLGNHLLNDDLVKKAMFNDRIDRIQEYLVVNKLLNIQSTYPFIDHIGIYNEFTGRYMNGKGLTSNDEQDIIDKIRLSDEVFISLFPRSIKDPSSHGGEREVFTYIMMPKYSLLPSKGAIVINVNQKYIRDLIGGLKNKRSNYLFAMNEQGEILVQTNERQNIENILDKNHLLPILSSTEESGYYITSVDGTKYLVSFMKSDAGSWIFVSANEYNDLLYNINQLKKITILIAAGVIVASLFLSIWLTNQMYNPIRKLVEKFHGMGIYNKPTRETINEFHLLDESFINLSRTAEQLEPVLDVVKKSHLLRYIKGSKSDLVDRFGNQLKGPHFFVMLLKIDAYKQFVEKHSPQMQSLLQFAICNIAQELMSKAGNVEIVVIEDDEIGVIGQLEAKAYSPNVIAALSEIQSNIKTYFKTSLSVGIGPIVNTAEEIRDSYRLAKESVSNRFFDGSGRVYEYDRLLMKNVAVTADKYPIEIEKKLVEAVQSCKEDAILQQSDLLFGWVRKLTYHDALFVLNQLLVSLYKHFETSVMPAKEESKLFMEMAHNLASFETIDEVCGRLNEIFGTIVYQLEGKMKNGKQDTIEKIKSYCLEHYSRPDLSLEMLADYVQLTPGYTGKLFKQHCNISFNDFLKDVRLEKARALLIESDESAQSISERVGIYNATYFSTLFKKKYGVSPVQYRNKYLHAKLDKLG